ncbi:hypothetical protein [Leptospira andrefontaineae]|uniref:Uncharacterized protein n=1 Tax=Leptospira andrefontaineae TaxID=2484976 RepID=A0A4R9GY70_9LEPT|nr:hypothetical protein [Leptospira andrefontaineae]TGK36288.1 hypothetical protein EHO65_18480 [Leptospira andrefontaineae]
MTPTREISLKILARLKQHDLSFIEQVQFGAGLLRVQKVEVEGELFKVSLPPDEDLPPDVELADILYDGMIFCITGGKNAGFGVIDIFDSSTNSFTAEGLKVQDNPGGNIIFFEGDLNLLESYITLAIDQCEQLTQCSFSGLKETTEYRDGVGNSKLILQRKRWRSITEIRAITPTPSPGLTPQVAVSDIDMDLACESGILQIKVTNLSGLMQNLNRFPKGKISIKGTYGYAPEELPSQIKQAIEYMACSIVLTEEVSRLGNANSFAIDGFTQSMDVGKDIRSYVNLATSLLTPWRSGEVGS